MRERLGDKAPPKEKPKTLETLREFDETMVDPEDPEVMYDEMHDEMAAYFNRNVTPKVLITISPGAKVVRKSELQKIYFVS